MDIKKLAATALLAATAVLGPVALAPSALAAPAGPGGICGFDDPSVPGGFVAIDCFHTDPETGEVIWDVEPYVPTPVTELPENDTCFRQDIECYDHAPVPGDDQPAPAPENVTEAPAPAPAPVATAPAPRPVPTAAAPTSVNRPTAAAPAAPVVTVDAFDQAFANLIALLQRFFGGFGTWR